MLTNEIWKDIPEWEGFYQVSNLGNVKSLRNGILLSKRSTARYFQVVLQDNKNKRIKQMLVHRLVAIAFIPNPDNKPCVNHKNGNCFDNNLSNLEWVTLQENVDHANSTGLVNIKLGNNIHAKLVLNTQTGIYYDTITEAAQSCGLKFFQLSDMLSGKQKNKTPFMYAHG